LPDYIESSNPDNCIHILGHVGNASSLLRGLDLFVLPSKKENFPYVLLEAGPAEPPVVANNVGGVSELLSQGENGILVDSSSTIELTRAISQVVREPGLCQRLVGALYNTTVSNFSLLELVKKPVWYINPVRRPTNSNRRPHLFFECCEVLI
jgi:glycosyltransferase involved in cell wall biosynthesis